MAVNAKPGLASVRLTPEIQPGSNQSVPQPPKNDEHRGVDLPPAKTKISAPRECGQAGASSLPRLLSGHAPTLLAGEKGRLLQGHRPPPQFRPNQWTLGRHWIHQNLKPLGLTNQSTESHPSCGHSSPEFSRNLPSGNNCFAVLPGATPIGRECAEVLFPSGAELTLRLPAASSFKPTESAVAHHD
jgi:hypothetical protein